MWRRSVSYRGSPNSTKRCGAISRKRSWWRMPGKNRGRVWLLQIALLIAFIGTWEWASRVRWIDPFFFSQPSVFGGRALRWIIDPGLLLGGRSIYHHLFVTLQEMIGGFVLGVAFGVAVGFVLGRSQFWSAVLNPYIQVLNALPRLVLAPIFVLLLGIDERS